MPKVSTVTFDSKLDTVGLYRDYQDLLAVFWSWLFFNPLQVPEKVLAGIWRNILVDLFCGIYTIGDVGYSILLQAIDYLYRLMGVYNGKDTFPTLRQLRDVLAVWQKSASEVRKREAYGSLLNRLDGLLTTWPQGLDCRKGFCVPELITGHLVLAINGLADQHRAFLVSLFCLWTYVYMEANNLRGEVLRVLFVIDEAEVILGRDVRKTQGKNPLFFTLLPRFREFGIGMLVASQSPLGLDERAVMTLARTKIVKNLVDARDIDCIGDSLGWTKEQKNYCRAMPCDQAAVSMGVRQPDSVLVQVPFTPVNKDVDWNQVYQLMGPRLQQKFPVKPTVPLPSTPKPPGTQAAVDPDLNDIKRCLVDVANRPHIPKTDRLMALFGNSASRCQHIAKRCVNEGYVREFTVHVGGRSGMLTLWRLTNKGYDLIGQPRQALPGIGDVEHQYLQYRVSEKLRGWGFKPVIELLRNGKRVDVGVDLVWKLIALEIATTPDNEVNNVKKDIAAGFSLVVVLPVNDKVKKKVERKFAKELSAAYANQVQVITIPDFLNATTVPW